MKNESKYLIIITVLFIALLGLSAYQIIRIENQEEASNIIIESPEEKGIASNQQLQDMIFSLRQNQVDTQNEITSLKLENANLKRELDNYKEITEALQKDAVSFYNQFQYVYGRIEVLENE